MRTSKLSYFLAVAAACAVLAAPAPVEKDLAQRWVDTPQVADAPLWERQDNSTASNSTSSDNNSNNNNNNSNNNNNNNSNNNKNNNNNNNNNKDKNKGNNNKNNNNNVQIVEVTTTDVKVDEKSKNGQETIFEKKVTKIVVKNKNSNNRKNSKRAQEARNRDNKKTTIIQVVQTIIQVNQDGSRGKRYAVSQLTANPGQGETTSCQMTDAQTLTVGECSNSTDAATATAADASATGAVAAAATADVGAPFLQSNQTQLLTAGAAAPVAAAGVMVMDDSASDISSDELNQC